MVGSVLKGHNGNLTNIKKGDNDFDSLVSSNSSGKFNFTDDLLIMAKKLDMKTNLRKAIFCIVMGAEDFSDAFEKLVSFTSIGNLRSFTSGMSGNASHTAERDIVYVLTYCCGCEKQFNPYYSILLSRICEYQRSYKFTLQLAF